jgi:hypothetical protein
MSNFVFLACSMVVIGIPSSRVERVLLRQRTGGELLDITNESD